MAVAGIEAAMAIRPVGEASTVAGSLGGIQASAPASVSFAEMLGNGVDSVNRNIVAADRLVQQFVVDGEIPIHRVTYALEEARLSLELMMQIRARLVEGYQQIMGMQI